MMLEVRAFVHGMKLQYAVDDMFYDDQILVDAQPGMHFIVKSGDILLLKGITLPSIIKLHYMHMSSQ